MYIWDPEATAIAGILGSLVSIWKVTTPVGRSIIVFSVTYSSRSIIVFSVTYSSRSIILFSVTYSTRYIIVFSGT